MYSNYVLMQTNYYYYHFVFFKLLLFEVDSSPAGGSVNPAMKPLGLLLCCATTLGSAAGVSHDQQRYPLVHKLLQLGSGNDDDVIKCGRSVYLNSSPTDMNLMLSHSFLSQTIHLLDEDDSLYCISAWNDQVSRSRFTHNAPVMLHIHPQQQQLQSLMLTSQQQLFWLASAFLSATGTCRTGRENNLID